MKQPIIIGRFGKSFGVHGWLRLQSYTNPKENILQYANWHIENNKVWQLIEIDENQIRNDDIRVHVVGIDSPEEVKVKLTGKKIAIEREQLPTLAEDEYYWSDLEGLSVITTKGQSLGTVDYLMASGSNDILVVQGERERLIPYIRQQVIVKVDLAEKEIIVDWDPEF